VAAVQQLGGQPLGPLSLARAPRPNHSRREGKIR
jgi:hypothetical protein